MRIQLGDFAFTLPKSWRDTSSYTYKSNARQVALTVSFSRTRQAITLEELVAKRRQELSDSMGGEVEFQLEEPGKLATWPAVHQSFTFRGQSNTYLECWATAHCGENNYLTLSYVGPQEDKTLQTTFGQITASCQPSSLPHPKQVAEHHVWRQAQTLLLQVPKELQAPRHYGYVSPDGGVTLTGRLYEPGASWPAASVERDAANDLRFGGARGASCREQHDTLAIEQIGYVFVGGDPIEPTRCRAHRAQVDGFGARLSLYLKGDESQTSRIDAFWQQLMSDLIEHTSTPTFPIRE